MWRLKGPGEFLYHAVPVHTNLVFSPLGQGIFFPPSGQLGQWKKPDKILGGTWSFSEGLTRCLTCLICSDTVQGIFSIHVGQVVNYSVGTVNKTQQDPHQLCLSQYQAGFGNSPFFPSHQSLKRAGFSPWGLGGVRVIGGNPPASEQSLLYRAGPVPSSEL